MKSKFLTFACIFALILTACACVNAATNVSANVTAPANAQKGETVEAKVTLTPGVGLVEFHVAYDPAVLKYTGISYPDGAIYTAKGVTERSIGGTVVSVSNPIDVITLKFEVVGENGSSSELVLTTNDSNSEAMSGDDVVITVGTPAKVTVGEATTEDPGTTPDNPPAENPPAEDDKPADGEPTKYPQTGVNVAYVAAGIALAVVAGYVVVKKH